MKHRQSGFTLIELMIVVAIVMILAAVAFPHLMRCKMTANETSALGSLNTLNNVLFDYWTNYDSYPASLSNLVSADTFLANGTHGGYSFTYHGEEVDANDKAHTYSITAAHVAPDVTGQRYFFTDQPGLIRAD
jgi:prepilin-type N-terminal cleavage/methylation domain-containing protein